MAAPIIDRPPHGAPRVAAGQLVDRDLDAWLSDFDRRHSNRQPLHGDFYAGNVLVRDGRIEGLLDWDEAFLGPPERELAWAAWEWSGGLSTADLNAAESFVYFYSLAGGPAEPIDREAIRQLVRERLRWEAEYVRAAAKAGRHARSRRSRVRRSTSGRLPCPSTVTSGSL